MLTSPSQSHHQTPYKAERLFYRASGAKVFYEKAFIFYFNKLEDLCRTAFVHKKTPQSNYGEYVVPSLGEKFEGDMHIAYDYRMTWLDCVFEYLKEYPECIKKLQDAVFFPYPKVSMDFPQIGEKLDYIKNHNNRLYEEVIKNLDDYNRLSAEIDIYRDILEERRNINWRRINEFKNRKMDHKNNSAALQKIIANRSNDYSEIAYRLYFEEFQSELYINERKIRRCNVRSDFGDAIIRALNSPDNTTKVSENMAQNISSLKIPAELRHMMFRVGGGQMKISPIITYAQIKDAGLDYEVLNKQFKEMLGKIS